MTTSLGIIVVVVTRVHYINKDGYDHMRVRAVSNLVISVYLEETDILAKGLLCQNCLVSFLKRSLLLTQKPKVANRAA